MNQIIGRRRIREGEMERVAEKRRRQLLEFLKEKANWKQANLQERGVANSESKNYNELALPDDIFRMIFILLPAESISMLQFVCKKSFDLINNPEFIKFQKQQSETVLISQDLFTGNPLLPFIGHSPKPYFHFVDFEKGNDNFLESTVVNLVSVRASCDGLILGFTNENNNLILMNPVTRKHTNLPLGTTGFDGSYGLVFCSKARTYKVVHLFRESPDCTVCEILNISTRKWKIIDGPSPDLLENIELMPVSVYGSLYWMPRKHGCDYLLSMDMEDEIFITTKLPISCTVTDRLIEIGGFLGFVTHATLNLIQVWILKKRSGRANECWVKRYSTYMGFDARLVVPICSSRNGKDMVFEYPGNDLYVYNLETNKVKKIYSRDDEQIENRVSVEKLFIPHRNTLASWDHHLSSS